MSVVLATYELEPPGCAAAVAVQLSVGMAPGPAPARARVVEEGGGRAVIELPAANCGDSVALLVSALMGEAMELAAVTRCRLVGLDLPDGLLPGPAMGASSTVEVGVIVKPSVGLTPAEVAAVVAAATRGGARFVKDDELHGDPPWCRVEDRVRAVADVLPPGVVYCANVTGSSPGLLDRAARVVELGATGLLVSPFAEGLGSLLALRRAALGVPVLAHRAGSGPWARNPRFGASGAVLALLTRLCGADLVIVGAYGGKLFEADGEVDANLWAVRGACGGARAATAVMGGGIGPADVRRQADRAGGRGLVVLLGSSAYGGPGGVEGAVRQAVEALPA